MSAGIPRRLSVAERRGMGRAARERLPRKEAGDWDGGWTGRDALRAVLAQNQMRVADLVPIRHGRMSASPWTFIGVPRR